MKILSNAAIIAAECHNGQIRKESKLPYLVHPIEGVLLLQRDGCNDEITLSAMMLHDTVEDTYMSFDVLSRRLGNDDVVSIVKDLTCYGNKEDYIESFKNKPIKSLVVKLYDRYINVQDFGRSNQLGSYHSKYAHKGLPVIETALQKIPEIQKIYGEQFAYLAGMRANELKDIASLHI